MRHLKPALTAALLSTLFLAQGVLAKDIHEEKHLIAVQTDGAELIEADVSDLAPGESRSFVTENGKSIDILKSVDGIELYIDGELQDLGMGEHALHENVFLLHEDTEHTIKCSGDDVEECSSAFAYDGEHGDAITKIIHEVEITCDDEEDCNQHVWISAGDEGELVSPHHRDEPEDALQDREVIVIRKTKTISSTD
jgi:hypothetical protein